MTQGPGARPVRIPVWAVPDVPGDLVPAWDLFLKGEADYKDLPVSDQRGARLLFVDEADPVQKLDGTETEVRYLPGDRFTGVDRDWLLPRLVLSPRYGRVHTSPYEDSPDLSCLLDGELLDPGEDDETVFLGPDRDFWDQPVATVGNPGAREEDMVSATLYRAGCWLVSVWVDVATDYLPVEENEMGEEKSTGITPEVWQWAIEMTAEWAHARAEHNLPLVSEHMDADEDWLMEHLADAARGGRGIVTVNGVLAYAPAVSP
jgi:hypothetical protein